MVAPIPDPLPPCAAATISPAPLATPPGTAALFWTFFKIGLSGFGGVMPFARRALVEKKQWLSETEFAELLSLGQTLPGPNIVNLVAMLGYRYRGVSGALACVAAILFAPMVIVLLLVNLYAEFVDVPWVRRMMTGIAAAAAGLILTMGVRMLRAQPKRASVYLLAAGTLAAKLAGMPLIGVLLLFTAAGIWINARRGW